MDDYTKFADHNIHLLGWTPQELALFGHAAALLSSDIISIETDYGLTDEGEPWLVFCDAESGDILGHFAKTREEYVACIPFRRCVLKGRELADLLGRFAGQRHVAWPVLACPIIHHAATVGLAFLQSA